MSRALVFALTAALLVTSNLFAVEIVEIFDGGDPGYNPNPNGYTAGTNLTVSRIIAADFELANPAMLTDVTFWTLESGDEFDGGIFWYLFEADGNGEPPAGDFSGFASGEGVLRDRVLNSHGRRYDVSLDNPVLLDANKRYWLGLEVNRSTFSAGIYWVAPVGWLDPPRFSSYFGLPGRISHAGDGWGGQYFDFAFKLYGSNVPEPAGWLLAMMGCCVHLGIRRR